MRIYDTPFGTIASPEHSLRAGEVIITEAVHAAPIGRVKVTYRISPEYLGENIMGMNSSFNRWDDGHVVLDMSVVKNGPRFKERIKAAIEAEIGIPMQITESGFLCVVGQPELDTLYAMSVATHEKILKAAQDTAARAIERYNTPARESIERVAKNASSNYNPQGYAVQRTRVKEAQAAYDAARNDLKQAKDELHRTALAGLVEYLRNAMVNQNMPPNFVDLKKIGELPRETNVLFDV